MSCSTSPTSSRIQSDSTPIGNSGRDATFRSVAFLPVARPAPIGIREPLAPERRGVRRSRVPAPSPSTSRKLFITSFEIVENTKGYWHGDDTSHFHRQHPFARGRLLRRPFSTPGSRMANTTLRRTLTFPSPTISRCNYVPRDASAPPSFTGSCNTVHGSVRPAAPTSVESGTRTSLIDSGARRGEGCVARFRFAASSSRRPSPRSACRRGSRAALIRMHALHQPAMLRRRSLSRRPIVRGQGRGTPLPASSRRATRRSTRPHLSSPLSAPLIARGSEQQCHRDGHRTAARPWSAPHHRAHCDRSSQVCSTRFRPPSLAGATK